MRKQWVLVWLLAAVMFGLLFWAYIDDGKPVESGPDSYGEEIGNL